MPDAPRWLKSPEPAPESVWPWLAVGLLGLPMLVLAIWVMAWGLYMVAVVLPWPPIDGQPPKRAPVEQGPHLGH